MTWRETLVDEVLTLLAPMKPTATVARMPDKPNKKNFRHPKCAVWVGYHSSRAKEPEVTAGNVQDSAVRFDVSVLTRSLHGAKGSLNYIDVVEELLVGKRISQGGALYWVSDSYVAHDNGVWRYDIVVGMKLVRVPASPNIASDPTTGPALKYALLENEQSGDTSVGTNPDE